MLRKLTLVMLALAAASAGASADHDVYGAMGLDKNKILAVTKLNIQVVPGSGKQVVCLATYLTGKKEKSEAVNVKLGVFDVLEERLVSVYSADFGANYDGLVGDGNLELFDLDRDGVNEIIVSFDSYSDPLIQQRLGEIIVWEDDAFRVGWSGKMEYDATKAARTVPVDRQDRFTRELDLANTLRTRGVTLFFKKTMIAVAGERLSEPKVIDETFPLRPQPNFR